ncbi:hypothetical protein JI752_018660 [Lysobacter sp. MMG2]|uniref:hypothetical protein n=1 Tax=Lysobacter sp. MMG2 TaxID=2801338 RepID=UPI001C23FCCE|nr:hypothetical protein [Lysobacter sp. MMG2]MBU8978174.1 hypothetical protein [Lysobacter sp. MMG2]
MIRQGLLHAGLSMLQARGGFGNAVGEGLQSGLLAMNENARDIQRDQYQDAIMGRMASNNEAEQRLHAIKQRVRNQDGSINAQAFKEWQVEDPKGAKEWYDAANPRRKNPGAPIYMLDETGQFEDPYVWDDETGGFVPAGNFRAEAQVQSQAPAAGPLAASVPTAAPKFGITSDDPQARNPVAGTILDP